MVKHFIEIEDYSVEELRLLLAMSVELKELYRSGQRDTCLAGKTMVMVFEKPSSRTRISFQVGMAQLGGTAIYLRPEDIGGLGKREPISDLTRVLNGYVDVIVARTFAHQSVIELAEYATVPVINALTDQAHPCQAMADVLTIQEYFGKLEGIKLAYIGDGNNVARSLAIVCKKLGLHFVCASPKGYELNGKLMETIQDQGPGVVSCLQDPREAVQQADVVYTDTWTSMGQEEEKDKRIRDFQDYQVNAELLQTTGRDTKVMHCLPAYRGLEISEDIIESPHSIVFDQAENRLHFQRALLKYLVEKM
jgi:ornithine carbamoyltransferase